MEEEIIIYDPPELLLNLPIIENKISQQPLELWQTFCSLSLLNFNQRATISAPSETGLEENKKLFSWQNKHQAKSLNKQIAQEAKQQNRQSYDTPSEQQRECSAIKMRQNNWGEERRGREKFLVTNTLYTSQRETFLFSRFFSVEADMKSIHAVTTFSVYKVHSTMQSEMCRKLICTKLCFGQNKLKMALLKWN